MSYALITGGSKGIGKEIAIQLAQKGYDILLVARSIEELQNTRSELLSSYPIKVDVLAVDLSEVDSPKKVFNWTVDHKYDVGILVNNAGYAVWGLFENLKIENQLTMLRLNIMTLMELCYLFLPSLKNQSKGYILNVASTTAYQALPTMAVYAAAKSFVVLFSRGLRYELNESNVSVTCLSPGATDTNFIKRAEMHAMQAMADKFNMKPSDVAKIGLKAMFDNKPEVIPGFTNWISVMATYFLPKSIIEKIAADLYLTKVAK